MNIAYRGLFDLGLEVRRGEVVALMGRNGAGKSTTMKAVMGLLERKRGQVRFLGKDIASPDPFRIARLAWASCLKTGASSPISRCRKTSFQGSMEELARNERIRKDYLEI